MTTKPPDLNATAARWQSALDAAARAPEADRAVLPAAEISRESHRLRAYGGDTVIPALELLLDRSLRASLEP